ncbi:uncharacterized protein BXZ73DRAFT_45715 [Epithele typhae]|uniref:uncharacterized protein n=1 Tax=Epithele typhae TaxID=378194 RepID=UPI0020081573|nr:uncharacterized protein BXZ73DRAFT_45715 [Epithele typhae]KAH9934484.1 hypothetical protein BXZ73DRAFT_45715 [Epithele typhae]
MPTPHVNDLGDISVIHDAQQFWSGMSISLASTIRLLLTCVLAELEDMLCIPENPLLSQLDGTLRLLITFCAAYDEQYLQFPSQIDHACNLILSSELFVFHSERMCELMVEDAQTNTDPHYEMILYCVILAFGRRSAALHRSQKRWRALLPLLMDHVRSDVDPETDCYSASESSLGATRSTVVPIEVKLRSLSVRLLYEVCHVQQMAQQDLRMFDDAFIDHLFDLVEQTRAAHDDSFNYSVIRLIVALNEQFMVASLQPHSPQTPAHGSMEQRSKRPGSTNRVLCTLMSRPSSSPTFGANLVFMLNRADRTPEDLCMQLLVLKLLYLLFTTKGMAEFFYTNDLCVLVDVFLREIGDIDEENESLRHSYLRVLHPLLTKTQLRNIPYKRPQTVRVLECLIENESIRDVNPTTKRLVSRCMSGGWCVQLCKDSPSTSSVTDPRKYTIHEEGSKRDDSPGLNAVLVAPPPNSAGAIAGAANRQLGRMSSMHGNLSKASRRPEHLPLPSPSSSASAKPRPASSQSAPYAASGRMAPPSTSHHLHSRARKGSGAASTVPHHLASGDSASSLPHVAATTSSSVSGTHLPRFRARSLTVGPTTPSFSALSLGDGHPPTPRSAPLPAEGPDGLPCPPSFSRLHSSSSRSSPRRAPPAPDILVRSPTSRAGTSPAPGIVPPTPPVSPRGSLESTASGKPRRPPPLPPRKTRRKPPPAPVRVPTVDAVAGSNRPNLAAGMVGTASAC